MTDQQPATPLYPPDRLERAAEAAGAAGFGALLLTPGPDLRYVSGYDAHQLERLTCLAIPAGRPPFLVVPRLELPAALASPAGDLGLDILAWDETDDPYALVASRLGPVRAVGLADHMWAMVALRLRAALPDAEQGLASAALRDLRMRKTAAEVEALRAAGEAIDRVHARVPGFLAPGRTEREVAADIADAIVAEGHARTDFTIVASGPNAASPHHSVSDRVLAPGDVVVVDIGGPCPAATARTAPGPTRSASRRPDSPSITRCSRTPRRPPARRSSRGSAPRRWTPRPGSRSPRPATASTSSTAPGTASAWRSTRTPTSWRATPSCSSRAWRSPSSPASTPAATAPGSRTSWCAVTRALTG